MRNEIAGKRIGNGNKREEGKELLVPSEKKHTMQGGQGREEGEGVGGRQAVRQETNASSIKQKCSVNNNRKQLAQLK